MTDEERTKIVAPLMQSLHKVMPGAMQASTIKQFVDWMAPKIDADVLLDLATHSEPARVEEYTTRIKAWPVNINGLLPGNSSSDTPEMPPRPCAAQGRCGGCQV